jgi:hypothetical protein
MDPDELTMDEAVPMLVDAAKRKESGRRNSGAKK